MAFNSTTGLGVATQIQVVGNINPPSAVPGKNGVQLSLSGLNGPTSFQLEPKLLDAGGNGVPVGTAFTLASVAASSIPVFTLTSVAASNGTVAVYTGTVTGGASNAFAGDTFTVAGFTNGVNNGAFLCTASSATTLTLEAVSAVAETHAATATPEQGVAVYTGTITGGATNAFAGFTFVVAGFVTNASNNGTFICTASSATTLTLANDLAVAETHAATATSEETTNAALTYWVQASKGITNSYLPSGTPAAVATCSTTGVVATNGVEGHTVVEVSYPFANNTIGATGALSPNPMHGLPLQKIYAEVNVRVVA